MVQCKYSSFIRLCPKYFKFFIIILSLLIGSSLKVDGFSLSYRLKSQDSSVQQIAVNQLLEQGDQYYSNGQYQNAISTYRQVLVAYYELNDQPSIGKILNKIGLAYYYLNEYYNALDFYQKALNIFNQAGNQEEQGTVLNRIGAVYDSLGEYENALEFYQQALIHFESVNYDFGESRVLHNIGLVAFHLGNYAEALNYYQRAMMIYREQNDPEGEAFLLHRIGTIYSELGQYSKASTFYHQALALPRTADNFELQGDIYHSLGLDYVRQGLFLESLSSYQKALENRIKMGDRSSEGLTLNNLGEAYRSLKQYPQAEKVLERALRIAQDLNDSRLEELVFDSLGSNYKDQEEYIEALKSYLTSLAISHEIGNRDSEAKTLRNIADLYAQQQKSEISIAFYKKSINIIESIRADIQSLPIDQQQSYTDTVADAYRALANLLLEQGRILEAQKVLEMLKVEELREFTKNARGFGTESEIALNAVEQEILASFGTLANFGRQVYECEQTHCDQLATYRQQRQQQATWFDNQVTAFLQQVRDNRGRDDFFYDPRYLNETARKIVAQPGTLLIYPFVLQDQLWLLYAATGDVAGAIPIPVNQQELGETVVHFLDLLRSPSSDLDDLKATGKKLYDWLVAPLNSEIQANQINTLIFAQDRITRYIPMAALWNGEHYLAEQFTLSTILSANLTDMTDRLSPSPNETQILASGVSQSVLDFSPLPNVETELDAVVRENAADPQGVYPGIELLNSSFNLSALVNNLAGHRILHIATHGKFVAGLPEDSFLVLGDGTHLSIPDINSIGPELRDIHLVVLSACETAVGGPGADGVEVAGISSYFLAANRASAVLASLWLVNDSSTSLLMQQFYRNLAQGRFTKAEALRQAQLNLLHSEPVGTPQDDSDTNRSIVGIRVNPEATANGTSELTYSHPYYWAPFILIGNGL